MEFVIPGLLLLIGITLVMVLRRLDALSGIGAVVDRLERVELRLEELKPPDEPEPEPEPEIDPGPPEPIPVEVNLTGDLRGAVSEAVEGIGKDVRRLVRLLGRTRAEKVRSRVVGHLRRLGYREVRITSGLPRTGSPARAARVVVDARIDGVPSRGHVTIEGGQIVETELQPLNRLFP